MPLHALIALASMSAPADAPSGVPPCPMEVVRAYAVVLEILDPQETRYFLRWDYCLADDLRILRERYSDLADAPPLCDAMRFPTLDECTEQRSFNESYRRWLEQRWPLTREDWINEALMECASLWSAWDLLRDAQCEYLHVACRRKALKELMGAIGYQAYYAGCMPPAVPVWRFRRAD